METQLGEKLGVSRAPIREAIRKLELEGLVVMVPRKGAQVAQFTEKDIQDVLEVRAALEALAAKMACRRMDDRSFLRLQLIITEYDYAARDKDIEVMIEKDIEFHETIFNATGNERLIQFFNNMREQVDRYRIAYIKQANNNKHVVEEHTAILDALKERNEELASELTTKHIEMQCEAILHNIQQSKAEQNVEETKEETEA